MKNRLREVMSQFYVDGIPDDVQGSGIPSGSRRCRIMSMRSFIATSSNGMRFRRAALSDYLSYYKDAYFAYPVSLRTDSLARRRTNPDKYYLIDTGLIGAAKFKDDAEKGWLLENFVYNTLRRGNPKIEYYLTESGREVDFLVTDAKTHRKRLVHVTWEMFEKETFAREHDALAEARSETGIKDCTIVTWEDERELDDGIQVVPVWKWALERKNCRADHVDT